MDATLVVLLSVALLQLLAPVAPASLPVASPTFFLNRLSNRTYEMKIRPRENRPSSPVIHNTPVIAAAAAAGGVVLPLCPRCAAERVVLRPGRQPLAGTTSTSTPTHVSSSATGAAHETTNATGAAHETSNATGAAHEASNATPETSNAAHETSKATGATPEASNATGAAHETSNATGATPEASYATGVAHETSNATGATPETSNATGAAPEASNATGAIHEASNATGAIHEASNATGAASAHLTMTEQDLWHRLEMVKTQILSKMQLKEKPQGQLPREAIPKVISRRVLPLMLASRPPTTTPTPAPDTSTSIILATRRVSCRGHGPADCFLFTLKEPPARGAAATARLWLWKLDDLGDGGSPQTLALTEVRSRGRHSNHRTPIAQTKTSTRVGWVEVDLSRAVGAWLARGRSRVQVEVSCPSCQGGGNPVSHHPEHRPFIVLTTQQPQVRKRRSSRECSSLWGGGCCRKSLNVSVSEMGWDDWLLHPQSFTFYYCHGTCSPSVASATAPGVSRYSNLLQTLMLRQPVHSSLREALTPCCAPTSYSAMPLLQRGDNNTVVLRRIPDLLVDSCGCND